MNVCFVGDSIVLGVGAPACLGWPGRVCARACAAGKELICHNLGVRGSTGPDVRNNWTEEAARRLPSDSPGLLVFSFGAADANQNVPIEESTKAATALLKDAAGKYPTLMVGPPPVSNEEVRERIRLLNAALETAAREADVPYLSLFDALSESPGYQQDLKLGDGVHPGAQGYDEITRRVVEWDAFQSRLPGADKA